MPQSMLDRIVPTTAIPFAVLGDSNSHSYQDSVTFAPGSTERGGTFRPYTLNWTEVIARLRPDEFDSGPWLVWRNGGLFERVRQKLGLGEARAPGKQDYLYNFANSGTSCAALMRGRYRQAPRLVALMDQEPDRWAHGVVVIRMGLNDWAPYLDVIAQNPAAPIVLAATQRCAEQTRKAIDLIQTAHPGTRVMVVGIANESDDPGYGTRFRSASESNNISRALNDFNDALKRLTQGRENTAFFDDAAWFAHRWGAREADGTPAYKTVTVGKDLKVTNTAGDAPQNALMADHHPGLVWNVLWAQSLILRLREAFDLPLTPITDKEIEDFVLPLARAGK